ncbi:MAG: ABC transporter substrate-binding protein [Bacillota bacterium]|jgi:ABC-type transport system substrate-binding protein
MDNLIMQIAQASRLQTLALNRLKALLTEIVGNAERSAVLFDGALLAHKKECSYSEECAAIMTDVAGVIKNPDGFLSVGVYLKRLQDSLGETLKTAREYILAVAKKFDEIMQPMNKLADNMQVLGELSSQILAELESTGKIAEKTNDLAHQAIQEAQKAGFADQGFAVIAGEVNKLAVRNKEAAASIIPVAVKLHNEIAICLDRLSQCMETARATEQQLSDNVERIGWLTNSIGRLFKILDQFNSAGQEITASTDETVKALREYTAIVEEHIAVVHQLQQMTSRLKTALTQASGYASFLTETDIGIGIYIDEHLMPEAQVVIREAVAGAGAYHLALPSPVRSFDPMFAEDSSSVEVCRLIYGRLVDISSAGGLVPGMAFAWESRNDGQEWTFYIRKNAYFHDGTQITAVEVAESLKRVLSRELRSPASWLLAMIDGATDYLAGTASQVAGIEVVDSHTLRFHLGQPYQPFAANLAHVACSILKIRYEDQKDGSKKPVLVGSGAYVLRGGQQQGRNAMLLEAFDNYYKGRPFTSQIIFEINPDRDERMAQYLRGNFSHLRLSGNQIRQFQFGVQPQLQSQAQSLTLCTAFGTFFAGFNLARPGPWRNQDFRKALNYGVDRQRLINDILAGAGRPAYGPVPSEWLDGAWAGAGVGTGAGNLYPEYEYNPEKAAYLLHRCGWNAAAEKPLRLFTADTGLFVELAGFLAESFIKIGVPAEIEVLSWEDFQNPIYLAPAHLYIAGWSAETTDLDSFLYPLFHSGSRNSGNFGAFIDAQTDRMLKKARGAENADERVQIYRDLVLHIHQEAPWVFLYHPLHAFAVKNNVRDFELNPLGYVDLAKVWIQDF